MKASLGRVAYEALTARLSKDSPVVQIPWERLSSTVQDAWAEAAWAVYKTTALASVNAIGAAFER